jgi:NADPH:quinone reductase
MIPCRAILHQPDATPRLFLGEIERPEPQRGELLVRVRAAGVNPADIEQSKGSYPPPPGASPILGLEVAGDVVAVGVECSRFRPGARVMALLSGGGYAEYCTVSEQTVLPMPEGLSYAEAAALPEALFTVWANVVELGRLRPGEVFLVHGGTGGVGAVAVQVAKLRGARVVATAGSDEKCDTARRLGADLAVNYRRDDFVDVCEKFGGGIDLILDCVGADYLARHLRLLNPGGRLVLIDSRSGEQAPLDFGLLMEKRASITGSLLRPQPLCVKARMRQDMERELGMHLTTGRLRAPLVQTFPLERVQDAHDCMDAGNMMGKLVLEINHDNC